MSRLVCGAINLAQLGFSRRLIAHRCLSSTPTHLAIPKKNKLPPRPMWLIKEDEIEEVFIKGGSGPGGQKINKTNSKVQLTHIPTGIVVKCQYSRSQEKNRKMAREILAMKLEKRQDPETCREAIVNKRLSMTKASKQKKSNRKYKKLEEEKLAQAEQQPKDEYADVEHELGNLKLDMDYIKKHL